MKTISFHPEAEAEVIEAAKYYEMRSPGLGFSFLLELHREIEQVISRPRAYKEIGEGIRRKPFRRFPYTLLYALKPDGIWIVAVAHQRRRPNYWGSRL